ncbi:MAG: PSD1 and planctomycete cytochrome C domain-containing protein [Isosphaeraceae bacterium]
MSRIAWISQGCFGFLLVLLATAPGTGAEPLADEKATPARPVKFTRDIRPILARHCFACHGPDEGQRKAKLRLDTREGALADRDGGRPFAPGSVDESEALRRITSDDPTEQMPPGGKEKRLSAEQVALLTSWVEQGAPWESHWAFEKPARPPLPPVQHPGWPKNPIDRFVLARLEREGLTPAPEADPATLLRRACLDLTGLPPTPEQAAAFFGDKAPGAYERLVDRLLRSPAYGERWARMWLDLARYADTKGYEKDLTRTIWRFRDWVIDAFNGDMPYDRFSTEQLAGDLLPGAGREALLATAFHRNTLTNDEGGTDDEEFRIAAVKDRVDTTVQVWMGLTMGCAKCHSHKYDPIGQKEYYQFYAFFDQTADRDRYDDGPAEPFPTAEQQGRLDALKGRIEKLRSAMAKPTPEQAKALRQWEEKTRGQATWAALRPAAMKAASGSALALQPDGSVLAKGPGPAKETYELTFDLPSGPLAALRLEALPDPSLPKKGVGRSRNDGNFVLSGIELVLAGPDGKPAPLGLARAEADFEQSGYPVAHALKNPDPRKHGWAVSPRQAEAHQAIFHLASPVTVAPGSKLTVRLDHQFEFAYPGFSLGRYRLSLTSRPNPAIAPVVPEAIVQALGVPAEKRTPEQSATLWEHFAAGAPETKATRDEIESLTKQVDGILASVRTPVAQELPADRRRVTKVHRRGNFLDQGEPVEPSTPAFFPPLPKDAPRNRLGVAEWLFSAENPLTARVAVNRYWAQFFGRGLVETQEDFGAQGQPPSHPELLDWLACELRDGGWSMKKLCRLIVTSATYRQSSKVSPELFQKDRPNRLLARGPRFRLEAEMIRDSALLVSGLLSRKMHGPSVMPHQPEGIWRSTYNTDKWVLSPGENRYRRGLYTFLKRTSPHPALMTFDAPSREVCTIRRITTNTPLQALVTLNDPAFIEAAQALARRMTREAGPAAADRLRHGLKLALVREPETREVEALHALYRKRLAHYRDHRDEAVAFATDPLGPLPPGCDPAELAALTAAGNVILNLDEFLTRN